MTTHPLDRDRITQHVSTIFADDLHVKRNPDRECRESAAADGARTESSANRPLRTRGGRFALQVLRRDADSFGYGPCHASVVMTAPRQVLPGTTYLVTRRCAQRQFLLRPSKLVNEIFSYARDRRAAVRRPGPCVPESASRRSPVRPPRPAAVALNAPGAVCRSAHAGPPPGTRRPERRR